jgi:pseudaminic acid biosynthesis-associated methylase
MDAKEFWSNEGGVEYTRRNRVDWRKRIPIWKHFIEKTGARSVFELGCNAGWNLSAIHRAVPDVNVWGADVNEKALAQAEGCGLDVYNVHHDKFEHYTAELTFTAGVLIHIPPEELGKAMNKLIRISSDWVLAIEYEADQEEEIVYRGKTGLLWKRPYGELYQEMGLTMIETGKLQQDVGFDNCRYWLMRK